MFSLFGIVVDLTRQVCRVCLRLLIDGLCIIDIYITGGNTPEDTSWTICNLISNFIRPAYTFNGSGCSYMLAIEVLALRTKLDEFESREIPYSVGPMYTHYIQNHCTEPMECEALETVFRRLVVIKCLDLTCLDIKRTYVHPVFGKKDGKVSLPELSMDAHITLVDIREVVVGMIFSIVHTQLKSIGVTSVCSSQCVRIDI